jgi:hypothetical protein
MTSRAETAQRMNPDLPVLCNSGYADAAARPGGGALLAKPYGREDLAREVHRNLATVARS